MVDVNTSTLQVVIEICATSAFALSGLIAGARKKLDAFGVFVVTGVAAFGGGTLRDVLLDRRPFFWVDHANWIWLMLFLCMLAMLFMRNKHIQLTERAILIPDALGLGLYAALGTQIALQQQLPVIVCALMGVMTAVFGGVLRDIFCNEIPKAFSDYQPYAVIAFLGGLLVLLLNQLGLAAWICIFIPASLMTLLRILAIYFEWRLPGWKIESN
ncbi:MAG: trimeric intracellular cation channel family protein [Methylotenera sp.]|uniref:trimeric intracellular cation channel family protein n=1 Tax=Methylotenera sp. TaxID=2051956 RepID=UPI0027197BEE|nr:trimeric intracellular cation channel family protein [Methylotenera sp.]MDO9151507.1 trimeric intracellular cation channel family protein [Methylotenera sp.]